MAQFSAGLSEVIAPAPWPTPEFLPGAAPYASETWDNGISLLLDFTGDVLCRIVTGGMDLAVTFPAQTKKVVVLTDNLPARS